MPAITNVTELQAMNADLAGTYWLANDIDASDTVNWNSGEGFEPVGNSTTAFSGSLDGQGFTISGLFIDRSGESEVGLFGRVSGGTISNVNMTSADVTGGSRTGILIGILLSGSVEDCNLAGIATGTTIAGAIGDIRGTVTRVHATCDATADLAGCLTGDCRSPANITFCSGQGTVDAGDDGGGLAGFARSGTVADCWVDAAVDSDGNAGGFIGNCGSATVDRSFAKGTVDGGSQSAGFVGIAASSSASFTDCYSRASVVSSGTQVGGFVGRTTNSPGFLRCYATGSVTGSAPVGGFGGQIDGTAPVDCFWDTETSGQATSDGGTGKTTAEMTDVATFTDETTSGLTTAWDFENNPNDDAANDDIWGIHPTFNDGYPYLTAIQTPPTSGTRRPRIGNLSGDVLGLGGRGPMIG